MSAPNKFTTLKDIAKAVAKKTGVDKGVGEKFTAKYFEAIKRELILGKQVRLAGFGSFEVTKWNVDEVFDPNVGRKEAKQIKTVRFKPSQTLKEKVV